MFVCPSGRAYCRKCEHKIKKLEIRGKTITANFDEYICEKCLKKLIKDLDKITKNLKQSTKELLEMGEEEKANYLIKLKLMKKLK
jgi:hypothetical protein